MLMRKFLCEVAPARPAGDANPRRAAAWGEDTPAFVESVIHELAAISGWSLVPGSEIAGTDEYEEIEPAYLDDRFEIVAG